MNKKTTTKLSLALITVLSIAPHVSADANSEIDMLKKEIQSLKENQQTLIDETSSLKTGFEYTTVDATKSHSGLGSAASKVYYSSSPLSIGGYGEMYISSQSGDNPDKRTLDVYRFVPYIGYKFTDDIILNTEIEFEHGGVKAGNGKSGADAKAGKGGEVIIEFMYLDFLQNKNYNFRLGHMLIPMGLINQRHEPTLFTTVQRPGTSKYIIPTTWHESGAMVYGELADDLSYKFSATSALDTSLTNGKKWIRSGRGGSFKRTDPALAFTARIDYTGLNGLLIGASTYYDGDVSVTDIHGDYSNSGLRVYGTYAVASRSDDVNPTANEATNAVGGYLNIAYDVLSSSKGSLPIFIQYETYNPEDELADGSSKDSIDTITIGANYFPHEQVVLKLDYAMQEKGDVEDNTLSLSLGFVF